jgi:hypothetical protein
MEGTGPSPEELSATLKLQRKTYKGGPSITFSTTCKSVPVFSSATRYEGIWGSGGVTPCILEPVYLIAVSCQPHALAVLYAQNLYKI